jgi:integrase
VTWDEAVLDWLAEHQHRRSIESIKRILRWLTQHLRGVALQDITDNRIRAIKSAREAERVNAREIERAAAAKKPPPPAKRTSGATVNRHLAQLSAILHYGHRRGWLTAVPPIVKAPEPGRRVAWLTREQARKLLAELPAHLAAMARFSLATGLRETNVRLLTWDQVDLARAVAWIHADQAKAGKNLSVPLSADAVEVLRGQLGLHKRWVFPVPRWVQKEHPGDEPRQVADSPTGKCSNHAWKKACARAGVPWLRWHDLRHTWASWHVQAGTPLAVLQELGGWASLTMVQRYAHLGRSHVAAWAGNAAAGGTDPAQAAQAGTNANGPEGPSTEVGWLMGLEPTTTGITRRSGRAQPCQVKDLREARRRRTG